MPAKSELHRIFCANIRQRREDLGMTQRDVAELLSVSQPYIAEMEGGRNAPTLKMIERYAAALGVLPSELLSPEKKFSESA